MILINSNNSLRLNNVNSDEEVVFDNDGRLDGGGLCYADACRKG